MATKVPIEILIKILNNLQSSCSTEDLYSSLLVNRTWCKVTIPILWELPLGQECCTDEHKSRKKALCIRSYISCMDTQARTLLTQNEFDLSSSPPQATFDYPSFAHKFIITNLIYFVSIYSQEIINLDQNNRNSDEKINKPRILFLEICKLIINRSKFVDSFKITDVPRRFSKNYLNNNYSICSILKLPGAPKVFKKLESFTSTLLIGPLYESLTIICDNILNMDLSLNLDPEMESLENLINVQKRLENLSIDGYYYQLPNSLFWAIIGQKETLKSLRLKSTSFSSFKEKSSSVGQFISLQELYIEDCHGFYESDLASSFPQLSSFHFTYPYKKRYPQEFIKKILETANINLRNIYLNLRSAITFNIFSAILNYCTKITELTLYYLSPEHVIAIFNNNFNELRSFTFDCGQEGLGFDANELLCQIAENVPKSLETIKIGMHYKNPWIFSANSLRIFFEGWCGGGNKKFRGLCIRLVERPRSEIMGDDHLKVIEEYGIQFDMEFYSE